MARPRLAVHQHLQLDQIGGAIIGQVIVERGIAARHRFQPVVEIEHHFVKRQIVFHQRAIADVSQLLLLAAAVLA